VLPQYSPQGFDFVNLISDQDYSLTVTSEHNIVLYLPDYGETIITQAKNVQKGDHLLRANIGGKQEWSIVDRVENHSLPIKYSIETASGTVLASSFFVSTICVDNSISTTTINYQEKMNSWRAEHQF